MQLDRIPAHQARAVIGCSQLTWSLRETPEGWKVKRGRATVIASNSRQDRVFASVETAIRRLKAEVGITEFHVEAMKEAA